MGVEKKVYSFRFDEEMVDKLRSYAREENRTVSVRARSGKDLGPMSLEAFTAMLRSEVDEKRI